MGTVRMTTYYHYNTRHVNAPTFHNLPYTHCRRSARICAKTRRGCLQYERAHRIYILLLLLLLLSPRSYTRDNNIRDFAVSGRDLPTTHNIVSCAVPLWYYLRFSSIGSAIGGTTYIYTTCRLYYYYGYKERTSPTFELAVDGDWADRKSALTAIRALILQ